MVFSGDQLVGQWVWSSPEAQELGNVPASDVYSFGLILLQVIVRTHLLLYYSRA